MNLPCSSPYPCFPKVFKVLLAVLVVTKPGLLSVSLYLHGLPVLFQGFLLASLYLLL